MIVRFAAGAALVFLTLACGGGFAGEADLPASAKATAAPPKPSEGGKVGTPTSESTSTVTGKLAPSLSPPSTLIVLEPTAGTELPVNGAPAIMDQAGYEFVPAFLIAQAGQPVQFRNSEDVLHNVRVAESASHTPVFNVATLAFGKYEHKFEPGYYNVTCDIHSTMRASILVTASPYTATTGADGSFTMRGVRQGKYNLTIYAGAAPVVRPIEVKNGRTDLGVIQ